MKLTDLDKHTQLYSKLVKDLEDRIDGLRRANDSIKLDFTQTAELRGQIKEAIRQHRALTTEPHIAAQQQTDPYY